MTRLILAVVITTCLSKESGTTNNIIVRLNQLRQDIFNNSEMLDKYPPLIVPHLSYKQLKIGYEATARAKGNLRVFSYIKL